MEVLDFVFVVLAAGAASFAVIRFARLRGQTAANRRRERYMVGALIAAAVLLVVPYAFPEGGDLTEWAQGGLAVLVVVLMMAVSRMEPAPGRPDSADPGR